MNHREVASMNGKISRQGRQVLAVLSERRVHLTAEEIVRLLPDVGQATVYRSLEQLERLGQIRKLNLGKRSAYYEYARENHMHFVCDRCSEVIDVACDVTGVAREAGALFGHRVDRVEVTAGGLCAACIAQEQKEQQ